MSAYDEAGAARYDQVIDQPVYRFYVDKKLSLISNWFGAKSFVLEAGCGTGVYTTSVAKRCKTTVGVDVSPEMIRRGLSRVRNLGLDNICFVVSDAAHLPFQDSIFDLVFSVNTFHHFSDERIVVDAFTEQVRCCRRSGHVLIFELNPNSLGWSKRLIPVMIRSFIFALLFPFRQKVIDNVEHGTHMVDVPQLLTRIGGIKVISTKVGGFIPTYCPKFMFRIFISLERVMEATPLLRRYGAHVLAVVGKNS